MSCAEIRHARKMAQSSPFTKGWILLQGYILITEGGGKKCECLNYISCTGTVDLHAEGKPNRMPSYLNSPAFPVVFWERIWKGYMELYSTRGLFLKSSLGKLH